MALPSYLPKSLFAIVLPEARIKTSIGNLQITVKRAHIVPEDCREMIDDALSRASAAFPRTETWFDNKEMCNIRVVDYEQRGDLFVCKALTDKGHYVDFPLGEVMYALFTEKIDRDGCLYYSYVWAVVGGQMSIIRVGSDKYLELVKPASTYQKPAKKARAKKIRPAELIVGNLYRIAPGETLVYAGRVRNIEDRDLRFGWWNNRPQGNDLGRAKVRDLILSSVSIASEDLGPGDILRGASILQFKTRNGCNLSRHDYEWQNGDPIR